VSPAPAIVKIECPHPGGQHRVACHVWKGSGDRTVLCVHGLSRNAHDFYALARRLAGEFRVVCVDMPGRGDSDWLEDAALYGDATYLPDLRRVMDALELGAVRWVGTSMGGLLGMKMAAADPQRIAALVLNDIGAELEGAELARLRRDAAAEADFASLDEAEAWFRQRYAAFGIRSDARWRDFTATGVERTASGRLRPRFDARAAPTGAPPPRVDLWATWDAIHCQALVLRGGQSALLSRATCKAMSKRGPRAAWIEVAGAGHAPDIDGPLLEQVASFLGARKLEA
jgi:pimeloyl-ACP methyl ester carboxylesterase